MYGIQFPTDPMKDQFLSSVISMVTPTWCHGPIGGNPGSGRLLTDLTSEFTVFNLVIRLSKVKQSALFRVSPVEVGVLNNLPQFRASFFLSCSVQR